MRPAADVADRRGPRGRGWAQLVVVGVGPVLLALSFTTFYRYTSGPVIRRLCTIEGGPPCAGTLATRTAWHGYPGWAAVVLALMAAGCTASARVPSRRRAIPPRALAYAALALYAVATACLLVVAVAIPNLTTSAHDIERTVGGGVRYRDLVTDHLAWGYWIALPVCVIGLAAAAIDVVLIRPSDGLS